MDRETFMRWGAFALEALIALFVVAVWAIHNNTSLP